MAKFLIRVGKDRNKYRIYYGAVVEYFFFGLSAENLDSPLFPAINLAYPRSETLRILRLLQWMENQGAKPSVHYRQQGSAVDIVVLFRFTISQDLIGEVLGLPPIDDYEFELILTGEFEITAEIFRQFLELKQETGYFYLYLLKQAPGKNMLRAESLWRMKLSSLTEGWPDLE